MPNSPAHSHGQEPARMGGGRVVSVQGPVVDVHFEHGSDVPDIHQVILVKALDGREVTLDVGEHLPGNLARCIAIQSTLNMQRHALAQPTGRQIEIPVGDCLYERVISCIGDPLDKQGKIESKQHAPIRRAESGTKVFDKKTEDIFKEIDDI